MPKSTFASKPFVIRDPIHGYVRVAAHERVIVDHPITQRLRRISQTGLADMVYPEARTSRFVHSLGAMHLASRFLRSCVEHAKEEHLNAFLSSLAKTLREVDKRVTPSDFKFLLEADPYGGATLLASHSALTRASPRKRARRRQLLAFAEAGLRLAALYHDLGHLPFSHDLEFALLEHFSETGTERRLAEFFSKTAPHEKIGHTLARLVLKAVTPSHSRPLSAVFELASRILDQKDPPIGGNSAVQWLHSLVDGELDVDRADYLLRDGRAFGFEFAAFDIERLIDNVAVRFDGKRFDTVVREQGIGALETFFISRARSNQSLVRHHKIAQLGAALRHASGAALRMPEGKRFLRALRKLAAWDMDMSSVSPQKLPRFLLEYSAFDDAWWTGVLRAIRTSDKMLLASLGLVLRREQTFVSVWKRALAPNRLKKLNEAIDRYVEEPEENADRLDAVLMRLREQGFLVIRHEFTPYRLQRPREEDASEEETRLNERRSRMLVLEGDQVRPLAEVSELVHALHAAWRKDVHAHAFKFTDDKLRNTTRLQKDFFVEWLR